MMLVTNLSLNILDGFMGYDDQNSYVIELGTVNSGRPEWDAFGVRIERSICCTSDPDNIHWEQCEPEHYLFKTYDELNEFLKEKLDINLDEWRDDILKELTRLFGK